MAALSITVASVAIASGNVATGNNAGETVTAGQCVYLKSSDSKWWLAQADGTAEEAGSGVTFGIALHASLANQPLAVQTSGTITIGATVAIGTVYYVDTVAGSISLYSDLSSTNKVTILGFGSTAAILDMSIKKYLGVAKP